MNNEIDGFYVAYMTAAAGKSVALLVFFNGIISGSDASGTKFDGNYVVRSNSEFCIRLRITVEANTQIIQGSSSGPNGMFYDVVFSITDEMIGNEYFTVETPSGLVNVRLEKLRNILQ